MLNVKTCFADKADILAGRFFLVYGPHRIADGKRRR